VRDEYSHTALLWAARNGRKVTVKLLLDTGKVDVDARDEYGRTALWWASQNGHEAVVRHCLSPNPSCCKLQLRRRRPLGPHAGHPHIGGRKPRRVEQDLFQG